MADTLHVLEGIRMIAQAKQGHPDYRFNHLAAKRFGGQVASLMPILQSTEGLAKELFRMRVCEEGIGERMRAKDLGTEGNEWHYYREYAPRQWGPSFAALRYVNDLELPYESVILEFIFGKIRWAWERLLLVGDVRGGDAIDGLLAQIERDSLIPEQQKILIAPQAINAVGEFETLLAKIPPTMYANVLNAPLQWWVPNQHLEYYVQNYRHTFQALPYNNRFEKFGPDSALKRAEFMPTAYFTDHHLITPSGNLWYGLGEDMGIDVHAHDAGKEQYLFVRVQGKTGAGYEDPAQIVLGYA